MLKVLKLAEKLQKSFGVRDGPFWKLWEKLERCMSNLDLLSILDISLDLFQLLQNDQVAKSKEFSN